MPAVAFFSPAALLAGNPGKPCCRRRRFLGITRDDKEIREIGMPLPRAVNGGWRRSGNAAMAKSWARELGQPLGR